MPAFRRFGQREPSEIAEEQSLDLLAILDSHTCKTPNVEMDCRINCVEWMTMILTQMTSSTTIRPCREGNSLLVSMTNQIDLIQTTSLKRPMLLMI